MLAIQANLGWTVGGVAGGVVAIAGTVGAWLGLSSMAKPQVLRHAVPLRKLLADAEQEVEQNKDWVKVDFERKLKEFEERRANKVREAEEAMARIVAEAEQKRRRSSTRRPTSSSPRSSSRSAMRRDEQMKKVEEVYPARIAARKEKYDADKKQLDESYQQTRAATEQEYTRAWQALIDDWTGGMGRIDEALRGVNEEASRRFLDWTQPELDGWKPPTEVPPGLRFGGFAVDLSQYPSGVPRDPRLKSVPTHFDLPALVPFPIMASMLIRAADAGKDQAITLLQALMLRFLTSIPAGKVRFTIIDPVGLGENFAAFMHLADYHELLVTSRIWTEPTHIEQRLTDLTEHMENVIQKYLRNEFETIEEYNTMAGEVAEPFRVLVVANFPTNFNDNAPEAAGQHRQQRGAVRRLRPDLARHQAAAPLGLPAQGPREQLRQPHLEGQQAQLARARPGQVPAGPRRAARRRSCSPRSCTASAPRRATPTASRSRSSSSRPSPSSSGPSARARRSTSRSAAPAPPSSST